MRRNTLIISATLAALLALTTLAGCSREKIDWKSAEAADTVEGYDHFIERHPDSALVTQARTRVAQLNEDRDWKKATGTDTAEAYREFLAQHENGKWAEEARIRIENFALDGSAAGPAQPGAEAAPALAATSPAPAPTPAATTHGPRDAASPPATAATAPAAAPAKPATIAAHSAAEPKSSSAAKPTHVAAAPAATSPSAFGIQLGAFRSQDAALKNWKQLQTKYDADLHGLFAHAVPVKQTAGQLFRLQAPVGAESRARAICASLSKQSQPCVVVLPQP
jgi:cell division septation protein DedD